MRLSMTGMSAIFLFSLANGSGPSISASENTYSAFVEFTSLDPSCSWT